MPARRSSSHVVARDATVSRPDGDRTDRTIRSVRGRATFAQFRGSKDRARAGSLRVVKVGESSDISPGVAYAISRRVGSAVVRNRLRRQLRALMRSQGIFELLAPASYLVIVAPEAAGRSSAELGADLRAALEHIGRG